MEKNNLIKIDFYLNKNNLKNNVISKQNKEEIQKRKGTLTMFSSHKTINEVKLEDFKILKVIGRGSFGKVCLVEYLPTNEIFAMKSLKKDILIEEEQIESTLLEKEILQNIDHQFLCKLIFYFQTEDRIFFVMPFFSGGELFQHLKKFKRFSEEMVRFYGAQIAIALQYLHDKKIIYRDLKPENILLDEKGYLCLVDFGMAKKLEYNKKALSFCGTPEYLAPEIIKGEGYDENIDWWSLGIILYEMICGVPPFYDDNLNKIYDLIQNTEVSFPHNIYLSDDIKDIIFNLLKKDVKERLGYSSGIVEIKNHSFFKGINFQDIENKKIEAPFIPKIDNSTDVQNFDEIFTNEDLEMSYIQRNNMKIIKENQYKFEEFSQ
jgi:serine/threonine protein kinase